MFVPDFKPRSSPSIQISIQFIVQRLRCESRVRYLLHAMYYFVSEPRKQTPCGIFVCVSRMKIDSSESGHVCYLNVEAKPRAISLAVLKRKRCFLFKDFQFIPSRRNSGFSFYFFLSEFVFQHVTEEIKFLYVT